MTEEADIWIELENSVSLYLAASTLLGDTVPPSDGDSEDDEPLAALRMRRVISDSSDDEPLINKRRNITWPDVDSVKRLSLQEARERQAQFQVHQSALDNVLGANGFVRMPIKADGNCFFEAAATHIEGVTPLELRNKLCDLLDNSRHLFMPFMETDVVDIGESIQELRREGRWSSSVADLLPLALAEWTQRHVTIFTSCIEKPKIDVVPIHNDPSATSAKPSITLALFQCHPQHYDACVFVPHTAEQPSCDSSSLTENDGFPEASGSQPAMDTTPPGSPGTPQQHSTPRKQGLFNTPPDKKLSRKRTAKPETWKKNVRKVLKLQGKSHVAQSGRIIQEKKIRPVDCSKCRFGCKGITEEERQAVFDVYHALPSYDRQKQFVCSNINEQESKTVLGKDQCPLPKKRSVARAFYFTVNGSRVRVCKKFFLATLDIGEGYVSHAMANSDMGTFTGADRRGKHPAHNRTNDMAVEDVRDHIRSFPCVESHYTRKDTKRQYLDASLTITKMYHLYKETCAADGKSPVSCRKYRDIFSSDFNLSFHKPKKDQCLVCTNYATKLKEGSVKEEEEKEYQRHTDLKMRAREEKATDKERAKQDSSKHVVTLDLQAVLPTPCGLVSQLYYKRKLSVYNFTIYSLTDGKASCYVWDETNGKKGSVEIASCLLLYLQSLPVTVKEVILYSDCCGGQNRNQYLAAAFLYVLENIPNITSITHKYLETGHTQMECDSMHSAISFAQKASPVFTPSGWDIIFRMARRSNPYTVIPIRFSQILDFKHMASQVIRNTKVDKNNKRVSWLKMKVIHFSKGQDTMYFKYDFDASDYHQLCLTTPSARRRQPSLRQIIKPRYTAKLPVSEAKKRDLVSLCRSGVIPEEHHPFYTNLPTVCSQVDRLEELDVEDCDSGEETD